MAVDFVVLKRAYERHAREYEEAVLRAMRSGWYIMGNELKTFETQFASYIDMDYCIGVNSGLDALTLAVKALEIGPGDEVLVPANTYIASILGVTENGATPVFVEPDIFYGMDPGKAEAAVTERTKAILPVHLYGQAADMNALCGIAERYGLHVIEDCAQSHGARSGDRMTGTFSTISCFSFYPTKPLGALGDSGALCTNDPVLADRLMKLRNYGSGIKYINELAGQNSRLDELQAAALQVGLKYLDEGNEYRRRIANRYLNEINNPLVELPKIRDDGYHVFHVFAIRCKDRDSIQKYLLEKGINTLVHYPIPPHLQKCYQYLGFCKGSFPISEMYAEQELSLPIYVGMPDADVDEVIDAVNSFQRQL